MPEAAVTSYHQLGGLEQKLIHAHIILEARNSTSVSLSQNQGVGRAIPAPEALGRNLFFASSQLLVAVSIAWLVARLL